METVDSDVVHANTAALRGSTIRIDGVEGTFAGSQWWPPEQVFLIRVIDADGQKIELALPRFAPIDVDPALADFRPTSSRSPMTQP